ncbi:hypothetical protein, partial [Streptomyces sp. NPDC001744]|uniref:hypothetical protein n=1 Tax=Streptomyces sp. NPDC001744 TaxID=3364606 RepID=UPI003686F7F5
LIFGTLLSSQGTDASFVLTLTGLSSGLFPSVFRVSSLADPFSVSATRWSGLPGSKFAFALSVPGGFKHYQAFSVPLTTSRCEHAEV